MKILFSCGSSSWGGLEMQIPLLARALRDRGHALTLLCPPDSVIAQEMSSTGFPVLPLPGGKRHIAGNIVSVAHFLRGGRYDILHAHVSEDIRVLSPARALACRDTPFFITRHMGVKHARRDVLHRLLYRQVRRIFAVSSYVADGVRAALPVPPDCVAVLPPGIDLNRFQPDRYDGAQARAALGLDPGRPVVGMLGRITPMKGHAEFLEAVRRLRDGGRDVNFVVAGGCGDGDRERTYTENIHALARRLGLADAVRFIGFAPEPAVVFAALEVFVFPSHLEAFGLSLVEAMAMGLPAVACAAGGVLDIVEDGRTGLLVPPGDPASLALAIGRLLDDPAGRIRLGHAARAASPRWDIARIAASHDAEYARALAGAPVSA